MPERIIQKIDRDFETSSGNWIGDQVWTPETFDLHTAFIIVESPGPDDIRQTRLTYPYIKPVPGKDHVISFAVGSKNPDPDGTMVTWLLTDGVYEFGATEMNFTTPQFNAGVGDEFTIPADWNIELTELIIQAVPTNNAGDICIDDVSLNAAGKIQHLPVVGIG